MWSSHSMSCLGKPPGLLQIPTLRAPGRIHPILCGEATWELRPSLGLMLIHCSESVHLLVHAETSWDILGPPQLITMGTWISSLCLTYNLNSITLATRLFLFLAEPERKDYFAEGVREIVFSCKQRSALWAARTSPISPPTQYFKFLEILFYQLFGMNIWLHSSSV